MDHRPFRLIALSLLLFVPLTSCVGPATPFGALDELFSQIGSGDRSTSSQSQNIKISFEPSRMVLHDKSDFIAHIYDPDGISPNKPLMVTFEGRDVTAAYLKNSRLEYSDDQTRLSIHFKDLRIPASAISGVRFKYKNAQGDALTSTYELPVCRFTQARSIASVPSFDTPERLISFIEKVSRDSGVNPTFIAGMVAQESGFDPKALSWAKAMGLMQITPIAEQEILSHVEQWPRHPEIDGLSYLGLKAKIITGEINEYNEWKLDPKQSLKGGIAYLNYLSSYWEQPQNQELLQSLKGDPEINRSEVLLASYNSGAARIKSIIKRRGDEWRSSQRIKPAHSYINKVSSYCYHSSSTTEN